MQLQWYSMNRNWKKKGIPCIKRSFVNQSIQSIRMHPKYPLLAILRYNREISFYHTEFQQYMGSNSIHWDVGGSVAMAWHPQQPILSVVGTAEKIYSIQVNEGSFSAYTDQVCSLSETKKRFNGQGSIPGDCFMQLMGIKQDTHKLVIGSFLDDDLIVYGTEEGKVVVNHQIQQGFFHHGGVTLLHILDDKRFLTGGRDTNVVLWSNQQGTWKPYHLGRHTGWVYDAARVEDRFYTVGADGIVCSWDLKRCVLMEVIPINYGVASTIAVDHQHRLYVGHHSGDLICLKKKKTDIHQNHWNSIWNMCEGKNVLYSGGADGQIICRNAENGEVLDRLQTKCGWINGMDVHPKSGQLWAVSSSGDLIGWEPGGLSSIQRLSDYWLNQIRIDPSGRAFLVTAEGEILVYDLRRQKLLNVLTGHKDQVLDLVLRSDLDLLISASVDGEISFWCLSEERLVQRVHWPHHHITSIATGLHYLFVASLEGDIGFWSLDDMTRDDIHRAHQGRIWKIVADEQGDRVATIGTDRKLNLWDVQHRHLIDSWSDGTFFTTCLFSDGDIYLGNQDGEIAKIRIEPSISHHENVLYKNSMDVQDLAATERVKVVLDQCQVPYFEVDVANNELLQKQVIARSGWDRFPQVFFRGRFIGAGSVLMELHRTHALSRVIKKFSRHQSIC